MRHYQTIVCHLGDCSAEANGDLNPPITTSTTFKQAAPAVPKGEFEYSRSGNPTRAGLERALADLEWAKYGLSFSSGLAAMNAIISMFGNGDHIICMNDVYGGTARFFNHCTSLQVSFVDLSAEGELEKNLRKETKLLWIETPTNPTLKIVDIERACRIVKNCLEECVVVVDNTFLTPVFQNPLKLGADIVIHSVTKYINGHCDVVMGATMTNRENLHNQLAFYQNSLGGVPSPFDCYLVIRGMKTLHIRMQVQTENAMQVARFLQEQPKVAHVFYPGLPTHPNHAVIKRQASGFGAMVSFTLKEEFSAVEFCQQLKLFTLAESLGGVESLVELPALMTHNSLPAEAREALGIGANFIRLSVGIEHYQDLIYDLEMGLNRI